MISLKYSKYSKYNKIYCLKFFFLFEKKINAINFKSLCRKCEGFYNKKN